MASDAGNLVPSSLKAFNRLQPTKLGGDHPPVVAARGLINDLYFDEVCTLIEEEIVLDERKAQEYREVGRRAIRCHVMRVANQRGAFTVGATSAGGHGPLTSASVWFIHFPLGTDAKVGSRAQLPDGTLYNIVAKDDEADWRVMESFRTVRLGLNNPPGF